MASVAGRNLRCSYVQSCCFPADWRLRSVVFFFVFCFDDGYDDDDDDDVYALGKYENSEVLLGYG